MQITLRKGLGTALLNAVRAASYVSQPVWRPIAFKVGSESNVLETPESVVEDMTTFISSISKGVFTASCNESLQVAKCVCDGMLGMSQMLAESEIACNTDYPVLHSRQPVPVTVIFKRCKGSVISMDNSEMVKEAGYDGFVAVNSRHCNVESFSIRKIDETDGEEIFDLKITTNDGATAESVVKNALVEISGNTAYLTSHLG